MNKIKAFVQSRPVAVAIGATIISFGGLAGGGVAWAATSGDSIAQNTVDSSEIQNGTLTGQDIRDNTLTSADVTNLTSADFVDGGIKSADIADGTVGSADLANGSVGIEDVNPSLKDGIVAEISNGTAFQEGQIFQTWTGNDVIYSLPTSMVYIDAIAPKGGQPVQVTVWNAAQDTVLARCVAVPTADFDGTCSSARKLAGNLVLEVEGQGSVQVNAVRG